MTAAAMLSVAWHNDRRLAGRPPSHSLGIPETSTPHESGWLLISGFGVRVPGGAHTPAITGLEPFGLASREQHTAVTPAKYVAWTPTC